MSSEDNMDLRPGVVEFRPQANPMLELLQRAVEMRDMEMVERMTALYERREDRDAKTAYHRAFARAKAEFLPIVKTRKASFGVGKASYSYEELDNVVDAVVPALSKYGLAHSWKTVNPPDGLISVTCVLAHEDGYSEENTLMAAPDQSGNKNAIQAVISTVTYLQRATLKAKCGLAAGLDDDAHAASAASPVVSAEQLLNLENEIERAGADIEKFKLHFGVKDLAELPGKRYAEAIGLLALKKQKAAS